MILKLTLEGGKRLKAQLDALSLSRKKRFWINRTLGRKVRVFSRARIRSQSGLDGRRWQGRADGTKKKMERGLSRYMAVNANADQATVTWNKSTTARVAYAQQQGIDEIWTASKAAKGKQRSAKASASVKQARDLRKQAYRVRRGNGWKKPTIKWITQNLEAGQAGLILRLLKGDSRKSRWKVKLAPRSFLGVTDQESQELLNITAEQIFKLR